MVDILEITGPIYLCIALGWLATRTGLFARADMRVLGQFVLYLALPALLFDAISRRGIDEILDWRFMGVYALGGLAAIAFGLAWTRRLARREALVSVIETMGMSCPNSGFVGYPINLLVLGGPMAGLVLGMSMLVENLLFIPLLLALADSAGGGGHWRTVLRGAAAGLWRNPLVLGLVAGLLASLLELRLPTPIERTVGLLAQSSAAVSLFVIGGSLAGLRLAGMGRPVARIALGKLVAHPLLTVGAIGLFALLGAPLADPALRAGALLTAACPMFSIYPILAGRHGQEGMAAAALLGTTLASFVSISVILWWLG
ncbi:MAG TPA: AEC family transporter [Ottowia sp.]|uniref:AEC family transporter n=1 Tax=Ottowia sp. TaxID=1898956 RepID=UPI002C8C9A46|nr:AEC family transporter [Ottowia sp.]HMN22419.1 AEC family transporter [Ottowia sp.]